MEKPTWNEAHSALRKVSERTDTLCAQGHGEKTKQQTQGVRDY